ncbi:MAG: DUF4402 domain-containing protein [Sphingomicrobium sp.]
MAATSNAKAQVTIARSAEFRKLQDLEFGALTIIGAGTAVVNPETDALTTTGGVTIAGGRAYAALFDAVSPSRSVVVIKAPNKATLLTRLGGTETMTLDTWTISGNPRRVVAAQQAYSFKIGGTLHVNANQAEGTYEGTFAVEVQYQ